MERGKRDGESRVRGEREKRTLSIDRNERHSLPVSIHGKLLWTFPRPPIDNGNSLSIQRSKVSS